MGPQSDDVVAIIEETMSASIKVEIFHQTYPIQGDLDEVYIRRIASYVDEKMKAISEMSSTIDTQKVAVLTALAIADELHRLREERGEREEILKEQAERCLTLVERALRKTE
jgi:cell division protein ZapA